MEMQGTRLLSTTQEQAWQALNDPEILKACIPGCDKFEASEPNVYSVQVALKIGPVAAKFNGKVSLIDIVAPSSYSLKFEANGGIAGFGKGESHVNLKSSENGVELNYSVNSQVGGKIAQLGQRLIDGVAKSLAEEFFTKFEDQLKARFPTNEVAPKITKEPNDQSKSGNSSRFKWVLALLAIAAVAALGLFANPS